jgi:hypothetical protein
MSPPALDVDVGEEAARSRIDGAESRPHSRAAIFRGVFLSMIRGADQQGSGRFDDGVIAAPVRCEGRAKGNGIWLFCHAANHKADSRGPAKRVAGKLKQAHKDRRSS